MRAYKRAKRVVSYTPLSLFEYKKLKGCVSLDIYKKENDIAGFMIVYSDLTDTWTKNLGGECMGTRKDEFINSWEMAIKERGSVTLYVCVVKLPTGAKEIIVNTDELEGKYNYLMTAYDNDLKLINNPLIELLAWIVH